MPPDCIRARTNEQQNLKTKPKTNEQTSEGFLVKTRMEYKRRIRLTNKILNKKPTRVNGRDGAPALMHRPAAIGAAPSPEKEGSVPTLVADHTLLLQGRRYSLTRTICAGQSTSAVQAAPLLATTDDF